MEKLFEIIHEDADLLVINKTAGLVCHPTKGDVYSSLISRVRLHLGGPPTGHFNSEPAPSRERLLRTLCAHCAREVASGPLTPSLSPEGERVPAGSGPLNPPLSPSVGERVPDLSAEALAKAEGRVKGRFMCGNPIGAPASRLHSLRGAGDESGGDGARPHLVNRLDRETGGVVVVAKNDVAARGLRRIWETRAVRKEYLAIVHGHVRVEHELMDVPLGRDERSRVAIKDCVRPEGAPAQTEFWVERRFTRAEGDFTLLRVVPHSGRKHQIRIHLAHRGHPIVGDKLYGGDEDLYLDFVNSRLTTEQRRRLILPCHALHACLVHLVWRDQEGLFRAEPESGFAQFALGH